VQDQREEDDQLDHDSPLEELFGDQLASADLVVISKSDLMDEAGRGSVMEIVAKETRPSVKALTATHGRLDPMLVLGLDAAAEDDIDQRWSHHDTEEDHDHDDFDSIVVELDSAADVNQIAARIEAALALDGILRIKGTAHIEGRPARLVVQGVGPRVDTYFDRPWNETELRRTRLVVIGLTGFDQAAAKNILGGG